MTMAPSGSPPYISAIACVASGDNVRLPARTGIAKIEIAKKTSHTNRRNILGPTVFILLSFNRLPSPAEITYITNLADANGGNLLCFAVFEQMRG